MESRTQMARPRPRAYSINPKVCAMATFLCGETSCQRARAGTPDLWQKRTTSVVTSRQEWERTDIYNGLCTNHKNFLRRVIDYFTRPRPRTWKYVLKDPRGQGHVLEDSITGLFSQSVALFQLSSLPFPSLPASTSPLPLPIPSLLFPSAPSTTRSGPLKPARSQRSPSGVTPGWRPSRCRILLHFMLAKRIWLQH